MIMKKIFILFIFYILSIYAYSQTDSPLLKIKKNKYIFVGDNVDKNLSSKLFDFANSFNEGFALIEENFKFGYINSTGTIVIPCQYIDAGDFSEGLAYFSDGEKYGYIDKNNTVVIKPKYIKAYDFINGFASIMVYNPDTSIYGTNNFVYGFINKEGEMLTDSYFSDIRQFQDSIAVVWVGKKKYNLATNGNLSTFIEDFPIGTTTIEEKAPIFPGGIDMLWKFISENTNYPISAKKANITGKSYISFTVSKTGKVVDERIEISSKSNPLLDKEALRVIKLLPNFSPGYQMEKAVEVRFQIPINFTLK